MKQVYLGLIILVHELVSERGAEGGNLPVWRNRKTGNSVIEVKEIGMIDLSKDPVCKFGIGIGACTSTGPSVLCLRWQGACKRLLSDHLSTRPGNDSDLPGKLISRRTICIGPRLRPRLGNAEESLNIGCRETPQVRQLMGKLPRGGICICSLFHHSKGRR